MKILSLCFFILLGTLAQADQDPLNISGSKLEPFDLHAGQGAVLTLQLSLPPKFHAYADKFKIEVLEPDGVHYGEFKVSPIKDFYDKFSKKNRPSIEGTAILTLPLEAPAQLIGSSKSVFKVDLTYQACSETYCLFPKTKTLMIPFNWASPEAVATEEKPVAPATSQWNVFNSDTVKKALEQNLLLAFALVFFSGILTSFTPCIFPMIPITLAILGHDSQKRTRLQNFSLSIFYVIGIATTYSILGVVAASSGALFGANLGHPVVIGVMCFIFFVMALSMYGAFEMQVPAFLRQSIKGPSGNVGFVGAYFSGIAAGVVASPCVGPVLVTLLAFVAATQNRVLGFFLLFVYAIGMGMIFLVLGAFTQLARKLPRSGPWMDGMKFVLGSLMLGAFYYYLNFLIPQRWHDGFTGLGMIVVASFFGAFINASSGSAVRRIQKGLMQALLVLGIGYVVVAGLDLRPALFHQFDGPHDTEATKTGEGWQTYSEELLQQAKAENKIVILDFFADWCLACHELDEKTFSEKSVEAGLKDFVKLRYDATKETPDFKILRQKYKIMGLPTVLFFNEKGDPIEALTLTQFENPADFLKRLHQLKP